MFASIIFQLMRFTFRLFGIFISISWFALTFACTSKQPKQAEAVTRQTNPVVYFEIPVTNMNRAITFYQNVFQFTFTRDSIDGNDMALFPFVQTEQGISGALAKGEIYKPTINGILIYFHTTNIDSTLALAIQNRATILYPKTDNGIGWVAEFKDSEGNRIALFQDK